MILEVLIVENVGDVAGEGVVGVHGGELARDRAGFHQAVRDQWDDLERSALGRTRLFRLHRVDPERAQADIDLHRDVGVAAGIAGLVPGRADAHLAA